DVFFYVTMMNESYAQPTLPAAVHDDVVKGLYRHAAAPRDGVQVRLVGSGAILREVIEAQQLLADDWQIAAEVWSATSYKELRRDALEVERWNRLHPDQEPRKPYVVSLFEGDDRPIIAVTDYMKLVPDQIARWLPGRFHPLGTDGFGRSDTREALRRFFEVDAESVAAAALAQLARRGEMDPAAARKAIEDLGIDPEKPYALLV
ncbi:MAG TPA: pyruvate dehydrogenase (acetyl-transferring), homodimeric type, partial [Thermoanaerobaculia bacterium]|nr:pyruvate dehydrogenase (acetyl-transferring), homodimeric type [Thermoanaerobaculia bacterium]